MNNKLLTLALVALLFSGVSSLDTNRYISSRYPDDKKLQSMKAPFSGIVIAFISILLSLLGVNF